jgi:hypothetical protein
VSRLTEPRQYKQRTHEEMQDALRRFCNAAWGNHGANERSVFSIPPDDEDADIIFSDVMHELVEARKRIIELEAEVQSLREREKE